MIRLRPILLGLVLAMRAVPSSAADAPARPKAAATTQVVADAEGTVISIDTKEARVTLKHGAIQAFGMPAMTMVFRAADPAMLAGVKPGDAVRFKVMRTENHFTVIELSRR